MKLQNLLTQSRLAVALSAIVIMTASSGCMTTAKHERQLAENHAQYRQSLDSVAAEQQALRTKLAAQEATLNREAELRRRQSDALAKSPSLIARFDARFDAGPGEREARAALATVGIDGTLKRGATTLRVDQATLTYHTTVVVNQSSTGRAWIATVESTCDFDSQQPLAAPRLVSANEINIPATLAAERQRANPDRSTPVSAEPAETSSSSAWTTFWSSLGGGLGAAALSLLLLL